MCMYCITFKINLAFSRTIVSRKFAGAGASGKATFAFSFFRLLLGNL